MRINWKMIINIIIYILILIRDRRDEDVEALERYVAAGIRR